MDLKIKDFSVAQAFIVATSSFQAYCHVNKLKCSELTRMFDHSWKLLSISPNEEEYNLKDWENECTDLFMAGLGDPIPDTVAEIIPASLKKEFYNLLCCYTEIVFSVAYSKITEEPIEFMRKVIAVASSHGIPEPDISKYMIEKKDSESNNFCPDVAIEDLENWKKISQSYISSL